MKKYSKFIIPILIFVFSQKIILGQTSEIKYENLFKHSIGVAAGFTTGYGMSYRYWPKKIGVQTTFAVIKDSYNLQLNTGITFLYKLIEVENTNLFLYQGNQYFYEESNYSDGVNEYKSSNGHFNNGIGLGIEFIILKRVSFNIMGGYASYEDFDRIGLTGETALYFKF